MMRRRARRVRALAFLVGLIVVIGVTVAQRTPEWAEEPALGVAVVHADPSQETTGPVRARVGEFLGGPIGRTTVASGTTADREGAFLGDDDGLSRETAVASAEEEAADEAVGGPDEREEGVPGGPAQVWVHEVRPGETLSQIAAAYGVDVETIVAANDVDRPDRIQPGQKLQIPSVKGALHVVRRGESLWDISRTYRVSMDEIIHANQLTRPDRLQVGQKLVIPGAQAIAYALRRDAVIGSNGQLIRNFDWPLRGRISSRYGPRWGRMHYGLDIAVPVGTPVRAAAGGTVRFSGTRGGYGKLVIIDHGNGVETRYAHNSRNVVRAGQRVARGEIIAYSGNTGNSTGPHLHFEIRRWGTPHDPERYLR